ncbi:hypothetical protein R80B4_00485 [Fibrobacteres bacterium R8-0-B4]
MSKESGSAHDGNSVGKCIIGTWVNIDEYGEYSGEYVFDDKGCVSRDNGTRGKDVGVYGVAGDVLFIKMIGLGGGWLYSGSALFASLSEDGNTLILHHNGSSVESMCLKRSHK